MQSYKLRRKVSQTQLAMCIKIVDAFFATLTLEESKQRR